MAGPGLSHETWDNDALDTHTLSLSLSLIKSGAEMMECKSTPQFDCDPPSLILVWGSDLGDIGSIVPWLSGAKIICSSIALTKCDPGRG